MQRHSVHAVVAVVLALVGCGTDTAISRDDIEPARECTTAVGARRGQSGFVMVDALPSGACSPVNVECSIRAEAQCACPNARGPVNEYVCRCPTGFWSCESMTPDAGACASCDADGGVSE